MNLKELPVLKELEDTPLYQSFYDEAFQKFIQNSGNDQEKIFYHYTNLEGFYGIVGGKKLWASHISAMNDRNEFIRGKKVVYENIEAKLKEQNEQNEQNEQMDVHKTIYYNKLLEKLKPGGHFTIKSPNKWYEDLFVLCFCCNGDLLSQWRGYGKESGISIGFSRNEVKLMNANDSDMSSIDFSPVNILYDDDGKVHKAVQYIIEKGYEWFDGGKKGGNIQITADTVITALYQIIPYFKDKSFKEESESRIVFGLSNENQLNSIKYRTRKGIIIPYLEVKPVQEEDCDWPIKEIIVGPGHSQKDTMESIVRFLKLRKMSSLIKVHKSEIDYRD